MGHSFGNSDKEDGVTGTSDTAAGVLGRSRTWNGVKGESADNAGVSGVSEEFVGVWAESKGEGHAGVYGISHHGPGVTGESKDPGHAGVWGRGSKWTGVFGTSVDQSGVSGVSEKFVGVWAESKGEGHAGVYGISHHGPGVTGESKDPKHAGVWGRGRIAGRFDGQVVAAAGVDVAGDIEVAGDIRLRGGDVAELFDVAETISAEPGTIMSIGDGGALVASERPYDTRVLGVVAGAGDFRPGLVLDSRESEWRRPIAMIGKAYCKADAAHGPIMAGDLLTTSPTPGHAMRVSNRGEAQGATIGKALAPLDAGRGLIPIVVTLR